MYWTRWSLIFIKLRESYNPKVAHFQEEMVVGNLLEVEAPYQFEPDNCQACVERVEFADLDVRPVFIVRAIHQGLILYPGSPAHVPQNSRLCVTCH